MITCPHDDANSLQPKGSSAGIELPPPNRRMRLLQYGNSGCSLRSSRCSALSGIIYDPLPMMLIHSNHRVHLPESNYRPKPEDAVW
ncbi:hypothetical protein CEXT_403921 [Caerostris extrusa]|uniref:Uncharacterized protein n=1 Tax=Caerostris extrusa TaxID=172846 RepID=A0AAV4RLJ6_CAEEX|nr:hypothetical protein CEXT_403921 [Caerostris extrusa]